MDRTTRRIQSAAVVFSLGLLAALTAGAQPAAQTFSVPFSDPTKPGLLQIELVNGGIQVEAHSSKEVLFEVRARGDRDEDSDWDEDYEDGEEAPKSRGGMKAIPNTGFEFSVEEESNVMWVESDSWSRALDLVVKVPLATSLKLECVNNGDIRVKGVRGELELSNTNGAIYAEDVSGSVVAETVNGEVLVTFREVAPEKPMAFSTLNGDIDVTLPPTIRANLRLESGNGEIYTGFDLALQQKPPTVQQGRHKGRFQVKIEKEMRAALNGGGPEMHFETFNGNIYIRKRGAPGG